MNKCTITCLFLLSNSKKITFRGRETERQEREEVGAGGEKESLHQISVGKKAVTLILLWPPVVLVTIQQLDVDNCKWE